MNELFELAGIGLVIIAVGATVPALLISGRWVDSDEYLGPLPSEPPARFNTPQRRGGAERNFAGERSAHTHGKSTKAQDEQASRASNPGCHIAGSRALFQIGGTIR